MPDGSTDDDSKDPVSADESPTKGQAMPQVLAKAIEKIHDPDAKAMLLSIASSRTTSFGIGPDPETAKILSQAEMHGEDCKLKAFQSNLEIREKQNERDHNFRKKKLNHASAMNAAVIVVTVCGIGGGLALSANGNTTIGNPILVASFTMLSSIAGKLLASRDKD